MLEFEQHVREHFARGDADGFATIFVLTVGGSAQLLKSLVWFPFGEGQPAFGLAEVRGFFIRDLVALFSRALLTVGYELRQFFDVGFRASHVAAAGRADGTRPINSV